MSAPRSSTGRITKSLVSAGDEASRRLGRPAELSVRDDLVMLVRIAAEIEHSLMVQYLYAAYSLGPAIRRDRHAPAAGWQEQLLTVAREEMGHLMSMQNALRLIGGGANFDRRDLPWDSDFYPFPLELQPFGRDVLAKYVYAEMSPQLDGPPEPGRTLPDREREWYADRDRIFAEVKRELQGEHPHTVAELFDRVISVLSDTRSVPDSWFDAETYASQAGWDTWGKGYRPRPLDPELPDTAATADVIVAQMSSRTQLLAGLRAIASQGESPDFDRPGSDTPSHFDRFFEVYRSVCAHGDVHELTADLPANPSTEESADGTYIAHHGSRTLANLSNLRYRMLLTSLAHSVRAAASADPATRRTGGFLMQRSFADMFNVKTLAGLLFEAPLTADPADPRRAGPPFEMPYSTVLPTSDVDCWRLQLDLVEQSALLTETLLTERAPDRVAPPESVRYLRTLVQLDRQDAARLRAIVDGQTARSGGGR